MRHSHVPSSLFQVAHAAPKSAVRRAHNNSAFFQDCNHGSAAMGIIELGVSQGLSDNDIYKAILAFNSFWFPTNYFETAMYFTVVKHTDWNELDPKMLLGQDYSSITGWMANINIAMSKIPNVLPQQGGGSCGV